MSTVKQSEQDALTRLKAKNNKETGEMKLPGSNSSGLGICTTCNHMPTCLFLKVARNPVWFCDEFTSDSAASSAKIAALPELEVKARSNEKLDWGLCSNCAELEKCAYRALGKAVLHCEEYR